MEPVNWESWPLTKLIYEGVFDLCLQHIQQGRIIKDIPNMFGLMREANIEGFRWDNNSMVRRMMQDQMNPGAPVVESPLETALIGEGARRHASVLFYRRFWNNDMRTMGDPWQQYNEVILFEDAAFRRYLQYVNEQRAVNINIPLFERFEQFLFRVFDERNFLEYDRRMRRERRIQENPGAPEIVEPLEEMMRRVNFAVGRLFDEIHEPKDVVDARVAERWAQRGRQRLNRW
ncbi:unnamed protein product [Caenorhabditis brenneri]